MYLQVIRTVAEEEEDLKVQEIEILPKKKPKLSTRTKKT